MYVLCMCGEGDLVKLEGRALMISAIFLSLIVKGYLPSDKD